MPPHADILDDAAADTPYHYYCRQRHFSLLLPSSFSAIAARHDIHTLLMLRFLLIRHAFARFSLRFLPCYAAAADATPMMSYAITISP